MLDKNLFCTNLYIDAGAKPRLGSNMPSAPDFDNQLRLLLIMFESEPRRDGDMFDGRKLTRPLIDR